MGTVSHDPNVSSFGFHIKIEAERKGPRRPGGLHFSCPTKQREPGPWCHKRQAVVGVSQEPMKSSSPWWPEVSRSRTINRPQGNNCFQVACKFVKASLLFSLVFKDYPARFYLLPLLRSP